MSDVAKFHKCFIETRSNQLIKIVFILLILFSFRKNRSINTKNNNLCVWKIKERKNARIFRHLCPTTITIDICKGGVASYLSHGYMKNWIDFDTFVISFYLFFFHSNWRKNKQIFYTVLIAMTQIYLTFALFQTKTMIHGFHRKELRCAINKLHCLYQSKCRYSHTNRMYWMQGKNSIKKKPVV